MRRKEICWILAAFVFLFTPSSYSQSERVFKLSGNVTSKADQRPVAGANITLVGLPQSTSTDQNGNFYLYVERATSATMKVSKEGFKPFTLEVTLPLAKPLEVMLELERPEPTHPDSVVLLDFEGPWPGVTDNDGEALSPKATTAPGHLSATALKWRMPVGWQNLVIHLPEPHDLTVADTLTFWAKASDPMQVEVQLKDQKGKFTTKNQFIQLVKVKDWKRFELPLDQFTMQSGFDATHFKKIGFWFKDGSEDGVEFFLDNVCIKRSQ